MSITTREHINLLSTSPQRQVPPSIPFTLPQLPTFESSWRFSQFRSQSPELPVTPSPTRITSPAISPSKTFINTTQEDYSSKSARETYFPPSPSPKFEPVQSIHDGAFREACTYASLALSISKSSTELSAVPDLTDSFTSSASYSSDEHTDEDVAGEDPYHASTNNAWNSYYNYNSLPAKLQEHQDDTMDQSYILPSAESCYALGFGKLECPSTPSLIKNSSPIRRQPTQSRPSPLRTRTTPSPTSINATATVKPSFQMRRNDSGISQRSTRTLTQQRYNYSWKPSEHPPLRHTTVSRPRPKIEASLSFTQALESIPPPPALPSSYKSPTSSTHSKRRSPPADYTPPYLSLFPMSSRHSTPNDEVPPFPIPTRRAPRPVTDPCISSSNNSAIALAGAPTIVLGSAGGAVVVEKSVWEDDSDDEEIVTKKWHIRNLSGESKGSVRRREKEKWGKRSASDVVKGLFGLHH